MKKGLRMKKLNYFIIGMIVILIVGIFLIRETKQETNVTKEETKVGFILNGSCNDLSYGQSKPLRFKCAKEIFCTSII